MRRGIRCFVFLASLLFSGGFSVRAAPLEIPSGKAVLTLIPAANGGSGIRMHLPAPDGQAGSFEQPAPLAIEVVDALGGAQWLTGAYSLVKAEKNAISCSGTLQSPHGSSFHITDTYRALPPTGAFEMARTVSILRASPEDKGFSSRFSLTPAAPTAMADCDFFAPGIWYRQNEHVSPKALASHPEDQFFYFREDRLPLPLILLRDRRNGTTLTLAHLDGSPTTIAGEDGLAQIIDARLQFGSIGILNTGAPSPAFLFPGSEGERTYTYGSPLTGNRWASRSHPVQAGVAHHYRLLIQLANTPDFPTALRRAWQMVFELQKPPVIPADLPKIYRDGMDLLAEYSHEYNGVISVPFQVTVPDGRVKDTSSQMGFVGQALPAAFLLLKHGLETRNSDRTAHGVEVIDFWVAHSMMAAGVPRGWYNIGLDGTFKWRPDPVFLRIASDGVDGALQAWNVMRQHGLNKPEWLAFCRKYGDWLVRAQNADGSYSRSYDFEGRPVDRRTDTTDNPIRFLVDLFKATGDETYRRAALRAGEFCWRSVHGAYAYVGGTPDNPNVLDKEGGIMALDAFLALYDASRDRRWLAGAVQAAWYAETWVYCWNIPMPDGDPQIVFPRGRTTYGLSLIATGHSGSDTYMAAAPFLYYRLYLLTEEGHFREMARMLLYDTKQLLDWDGTLGYAHPGLQTEALSLPPLRGHGVKSWLPWLTVAQLEPLMRLHDVFGSMNIDAIDSQPRWERLRQEEEFSATRGFTWK